MGHLKEKFKLDKIAETRLSDILARCSDEKKDEYYHDLERPKGDVGGSKTQSHVWLDLNFVLSPL